VRRFEVKQAQLSPRATWSSGWKSNFRIGVTPRLISRLSCSPPMGGWIVRFGIVSWIA
jgi:hypothetical protein